MTLTSNITIEQNNQHEYKYLITADPTKVISNWMFRAANNDFLEVHLNILGHPIPDAALGDYIGERYVSYFSGKLFVENTEDFWTYFEATITYGIAPSDWVTYFQTDFGGYFNHSTDFIYSPAAVASEIDSKYTQIIPFAFNGNQRLDYQYSYV